jgi:hypothetical protein
MEKFSFYTKLMKKVENAKVIIKKQKQNKQNKK